MTRKTQQIDESRFLVIDGHSFGRNLVKSMLTRNGAREVVVATSSDEAVDLLRNSREQPFDCIISDWYLSPMSGLELLQRIRCMEVPGAEPNICFIILTGFADAGLVNLAINLDANAYILKPMSAQRLMNWISFGFARRWKLRSRKYYEAIEGLGVPPDMLDRSTQQRRKFHLYDRLGTCEAGTMPENAHEEPLLLKLSQSVPSSEKLPEIPNVCLALIEEIEAGDILGQDVYDAQGQLLVSRGTFLSAGAIQRLQDLAIDSGEGVKLWVGNSSQATDASARPSQ